MPGCCVEIQHPFIKIDTMVNIRLEIERTGVQFPARNVVWVCFFPTSFFFKRGTGFVVLAIFHIE